MQTARPNRDHDEGHDDRHDARATDVTLRLLRQRAAELARPHAPEDAEDVVEVLEFRLGGDRYALPTRYVREVVAVGRPTPLPGGGSLVRGLANVRGEILSVLDLRALLGAESASPGGPGLVIVLNGDHMVFGLEAETVLGVRYVSAIHDRPPARRSRYLRGLTGDGVALIDAAELLGDATLVVNHEAAAVPREPAPARPAHGGRA